MTIILIHKNAQRISKEKYIFVKNGVALSSNQVKRRLWAKLQLLTRNLKICDGHPRSMYQLSLVCYGPVLYPNIRPCITYIYKFIVLCSNKHENIIYTLYLYFILHIYSICLVLGTWYLVVDRIEQEILQCEVQKSSYRPSYHYYLRQSSTRSSVTSSTLRYLCHNSKHQQSSQSLIKFQQTNIIIN